MKSKGNQRNGMAVWGMTLAHSRSEPELGSGYGQIRCLVGLLKIDK